MMPDDWELTSLTLSTTTIGGVVEVSLVHCHQQT